MKKRFLLTLILMFAILATPVYAASIPSETEDNYTANTATLISGNAIEGVLSQKDDIDYYKFNANEDYFTVNFNISDKNLSSNPGDGWRVTIYDYIDNALNLLYSFDTKTSHATPRFAMSGTVYVKIEAVDNHYDPPVGVIYELSYTSNSDSYWESEYNDLSTSANTITANKTYTGSLHKKNDADWFKVTTKDYFTVTLSKNNITENNIVGDGWCVTVYDTDKKELSSFTTTTSGTSIKYPISGTVYVRITATDSQFDPPLNAYYDISVNTVTDSKWENEYNDISTKANTITQGVTYHGNLHSSKDVDYFKVKSTSGAIAVQFTINLDEVEPEAVGDGWKITVYAQDSSKYLASYTVSEIGSFKSITLPYAKGNYYYVKVEAADNRYDYPLNQPYHIAVVDASGGKLWEVENGKTGVSSATALAENKTIYGNLFKKGDYDYYKCSVVSAGTLNVNFKRAEADNDGDGYQVNVINSAGKVISSVNIDNVLSGKLSNISVSKGTYYIVVTNRDYTAPGADINYNLSYSLTLAKPVIKSATPSSGTIKVSWSKVSGVTGYQVQYATNKSFSDAKTVSTSSASTTIKNLSATKVYYVRMRNVIKSSSSTRYSAWSNTKVVINTSAVKSISSSKNTLKVSWNKMSGVTGYQVQYSTNKSFSGAKTVSTSSTSYTIKSTSATKVYYVRIRSVLKSGSSTYYSAWSAAKAAINTPTVKKVAPSKNTLKVSWDKNVGATGYQIQYSTYKSFSKSKTVNISKNSVTNVTIKNTSATKTYYVRIRTVLKSSTTTYSPWSTAYVVKAK